MHLDMFLIFGKTHSEDQKKKWSKNRKGNIVSEETKEKISKSHTDVPLSDEHRKRIGESLKGREFSEIHKQKISTSRRKNKQLFSGENSNFWKGGYFSKNIPLFDTYAEKLTIEEDPKPDDIDPNVLTVICSNCKKRFIPLLQSVHERVRALNSEFRENRLYCSEECKKSCSIFKKILYQEDHPKKEFKIYTQKEYKQFRECVLERDDYKCQYCGKPAEHVHHEIPQKLDPFYSLDPDYAWSCCKKCHYEKGHKDECSTANLANKICK